MRALDTLFMSAGAIVANKLRSALTLVGIVAGVTSIIAVMTGLSVVQETLEREMSVLGAQVFQVQKWPAGGFASDAERRRAMRRPPITVAHADAIREHVDSVDLVGSELWDFGFVVKYRGEATNPNITICGGTPEYPPNNTHTIGLGRNLSQTDLRGARKVVVIGHAIGQRLFPFTDPVGKEVLVDDRKYEVIGVFDEKRSAFGGHFDHYVLMPITTYQKIYGARDRFGNPESVNITVRIVSGASLEEAMDQTRAVLRMARGVSPKEEDNFFFFTSDSQI